LFQIADFIFVDQKQRNGPWGCAMRNVDFNRWIVVGGVNDLFGDQNHKTQK